MVFRTSKTPERKMIGLAATNPVQWLRIGILGLLLGAIYYSSLNWLVTRDWPRDDYTHCYLIPFIVIYLIWEKRQYLVKIRSVASWAGFGLLVVGLSLFWLGELSGELFALYLSSWLVLVAILWALIGWEKLKTIFFRLCLLLTAFPLPHFLNNKVTVGLKLISSQLGVAMMRLYGMSAYREGNIIDLGFTQLQVVDACSGLRYLFPLIVLGIILAFLFKAAFWKRAGVVVSTVPLSIITNSLRIALTGILYEMWGSEVAEGFFHGFSGWFIFMFSFGVLLVEMKVLGFKFSVLGKKGASREQDRDESEDGFGGPGFSKESTPKASNLTPKTGGAWKTLLHPPQFVVVVILLGGTLALSQGVEFREKVPITRAFNEFPIQIGEWTGTRQSMEQKFIDELDLSDYTIIDYRNWSGKDMNFYVAYYESQRKGESIHSPETCLPGSGWVFNQTGVVKVPMPGTKNGFMSVNRAVIQKGAYKQLSYYWFPQRGRILTNAYQLKIFAFWDALTRQRTDGALVRLITPVYENEPLDHADARLQGFTKEIVPVLGGFIPE
jgi:exosortase D (VPLPA-CTERM-specific)